MKKYLSVILILIFSVSLFGCNIKDIEKALSMDENEPVYIALWSDQWSVMIYEATMGEMRPIINMLKNAEYTESDCKCLANVYIYTDRENYEELYHETPDYKLMYKQGCSRPHAYEDGDTFFFDAEDSRAIDDILQPILDREFVTGVEMDGVISWDRFPEVTVSIKDDDTDSISEFIIEGDATRKIYQVLTDNTYVDEPCESDAKYTITVDGTEFFMEEPTDSDVSVTTSCGSAKIPPTSASYLETLILQ